MWRGSDIASRLRDERGSVLVVAGIMALAFVLLGSVIVEVGQWFEHRRAIQVRTDAAALAGGQVLAQCFNVGINGVSEATVDNEIEGWAKSYGGIAGGASTQTGAPYNPQFGKSASNLMSFQSSTYPSAGTQQPTKDLGDECYKDGDPTNTDPSNLNLMLDVKTTQSGIPPLFSFSPLATVHGWARVQLQQIQSLTPSMPLAVPDVAPKDVAVTFVDASTGQALTNCETTTLGTCVFPLSGPTQSPPKGSNVPPTGYLNDWGGSATIPIPPANTNIAMRVGIGTNVGSCAGVNAVQNQTQNYTCYDYSTGGSPSDRGVVQLRSYDSTGSGSTTNPILGAVTPSTCSGYAAGGTPFFSSYEADQVAAPNTGTCDSTVKAVVDFGAGANAAQEQIRGALKGSSGGSTTVTFTAGANNTWTGDFGNLPISQGPYDVTLQWKYGAGGSWNNFNSGNPVQQIFSGSDGSDSTLPGGPIFAASVTSSTDTNGPTYSLPYDASTPNATATLAVTVGLTGGVHLPTITSSCTGSGAGYSCTSDPPVLLRLSTGSQTYAVNCGTVPGGSGPALLQQIQNGCANPFSLNGVDICPDPANPTPTDCAPIANFTGVKLSQVQNAMDNRFAPNGVCDPNSYPTPGTNDNRAVTLIVTDFSAFSGNGGTTTVPVITFATFYVTGWSTANNFTACNGINGPAPPTFNPKGNSAAIWGHFIAYANPSATPSGKKCTGGVTPCVAALVR